MNRGLYISATSLLLNQKKLDVVSNNLANVNTTGFKRDLVVSESFNEVLLSKINDKNEINNTEFKGIDIKENDNSWELSTDVGFFKVETPNGTSYGRGLKFIVDKEGYLKTFYRNENDELKTESGNYVLGKNGKIKIDGKLSIDKNGNILSDGKIVDNILVFTPPKVIGTISAGVRLDKVYTNFSEGNMIQTGNDLDFALKGDGFFKIYDGEKTIYTRDGSFSLNDKGELITSEGYFVVGKYGSIIVNGENFNINENGEIILDDEVIDKLDIVKLSNKEYLRKIGNNTYKFEDNIEPEETKFNGQVLKGYLESSNVDTIKEMVNMINVLRNYESNQKVINSYDDMLSRAVNDIAKL